jgi:hypothetical protein
MFKPMIRNRKFYFTSEFYSSQPLTRNISKGKFLLELVFFQAQITP